MSETPFKIISNAEVWEEIKNHAKTTGEGGHTDHETRLRKLEWRYNALLAGLLTGILGALAVIARLA